MSPVKDEQVAEEWRLSVLMLTQTERQIVHLIFAGWEEAAVLQLFLCPAKCASEEVSRGVRTRNFPGRPGAIKWRLAREAREGG